MKQTASLLFNTENGGDVLPKRQLTWNTQPCISEDTCCENLKSSVVERNVSEEPAESMFRVEVSTRIYVTPPEDIN
jgi:hypothetical protein